MFLVQGGAKAMSLEEQRSLMEQGRARVESSAAAAVMAKVGEGIGFWAQETVEEVVVGSPRDQVKRLLCLKRQATRSPWIRVGHYGPFRGSRTPAVELDF